MEPIQVTPIGVVRSPSADRSDVDWGAVESTIELDSERFTEEALLPDAITTTARHPRENPAWPRVGIFSEVMRRYYDE